VSAGDVLDVALEDLPGGRAITARDSSGALVGAITSRVPDLIRCLQAGFAFEARVVVSAPPQIDVNVHPA
jgi:hypothetical protein